MKFLIDATPVEIYVFNLFIKAAIENIDDVIAFDMSDLKFKQFYGVTKEQFNESLKAFEDEIKSRQV